LGPFSVALGDLGNPLGPKGGWQEVVVTNPNGGTVSVLPNDCSWSAGSARARFAPDGDAQQLVLASSCNTTAGGSRDAFALYFSDSMGVLRPDTFQRFAEGAGAADEARDHLDLFFWQRPFARPAADREATLFFNSTNTGLVFDRRNL